MENTAGDKCEKTRKKIEHWLGCGRVWSDALIESSDLLAESLSTITAMQKNLADLQSLYDHVLECEQNRCREVVELQDKLAELRRRIDEAPVICSEGMTENDAYEVVEREWSEHPESKFRLVRDDQPGETNA